MGAPGDTDGGEEVAQRTVDADTHPDAAEADHGQEAVAEDGGCAVGVDACLGHEVEQEVDGGGAEEADAVDVRELGFPGLHGLGRR